MGTRSLAALLVFRSFVNVVRPRLQAERLMSVAAFEEPEAHLHPQSQRAVFQLLAGIGGQKVVSTHSTHVAAIADLHEYRLFRRTGSTTVVSEVARGAKWNSELIRRFVQCQNPEVLFAKAVGIVEGQSEAASFPVFARAWWPPRGADGVGVSLIYTEGAGSSKHIIPFLECLGVPWAIFCDGDKAGDDGLVAAGKAVGRTLDRTTKEVVQLSVGEAFEDFLLAAGLEAEIEAAANDHESGPLKNFIDRLQGQKRKGGAIRDYSGAKGREHALVDFLKDNKGTVGNSLATKIVEMRGREGLPSLVKEFFGRLDDLRGATGG